MKCKNCSGNGRVTIGWDSYPCDFCHGTGEIKQTEQEYIQNCDTEQLAEWIARRVNESVESALYDDYLHDGKIDWRDYMVGPDDIVEWLKQPHTTIKE